MAEERCNGCFMECERRDVDQPFPCGTETRRLSKERRGPVWKYDEDSKTWSRKVLDDGWK